VPADGTGALPRGAGSAIGTVEGSGVLTPARRLLYSLGPFGSSLLQQTVLLWVFYYYAPPASQGLPARVTPALVGLAMGLGRVVDAVVDPLVAHWSDRHRAPGGRRRPFILAGAPLMAVTFALIWRPPDAEVTMANFVYLALLLGLFFLLFTLVLNPYMALLPEITAPGRDRVATAAWQTIFTLSGTAVAFVLSADLASRSSFASMGVILAPLGALPMIIAALAIREHPVDAGRVPFSVALRIVFANARFRCFILAFALFWMGLSLVNLALALLVTVLMGLPQAAVSSVLATSVATMLVSTPVVTRLTHRWGSARVLLGSMILAGAALPLLASIGAWPVPLTPRAQGYLLVVLASPSLAALFILPNTILADIAQAAADTHGRRIEGMFFAFQGLILNGSTSVSSVVLGSVLSLFGYDVGLRVAPVVAAGFVIAGIAVFRQMPAR
jgi:GPH family glycoside/pentoside/hexuronide:cation symporter